MFFLSVLHNSGSSPVTGLKASLGMPSAMRAGTAPSRELPHLIWWSRKDRGLPGSKASIQSATLHSSTDIGLRSTPYTQRAMTRRRAERRAFGAGSASPVSMAANRLAMRCAAATKKCPLPQEGSHTFRFNKA